MIRTFILGWLLVIVLSVCKENPLLASEGEHNFGIIPAPTTIKDAGMLSNIQKINLFLSDEMKSSYTDALLKGIKNVSQVSQNQSNVQYINVPELGPEGYKLDIKKDNIEISAGTRTGLQYALVSLVQVIQFSGFPLPQVSIEDSPKFAYRGMHLDVARHFFSVEDVKKYLDYMAYYKFNNFHWHLTDDQGWRMKSKNTPNSSK